MAAVLACGEGAALSHRSAAVLWGLLRPVAGPIHVSLPSSSGRERRTGIRIHRCASLTAGEVTRRLGIPVTTPSRTIADLRGTVPENQLHRAVREAEVKGLRTGVRTVEPTRSELEVRFLRLCRLHRLPPPEVNVRIGRWEVDFLWRDRKLVVETDGCRYHRGATAFEDDRTRDLALHGLGLTVLRLTYRQVTTEPASIAATIRRELG